MLAAMDMFSPIKAATVSFSEKAQADPASAEEAAADIPGGRGTKKKGKIKKGPRGRAAGGGRRGGSDLGAQPGSESLAAAPAVAEKVPESVFDKYLNARFDQERRARAGFVQVVVKDYATGEVILDTLYAPTTLISSVKMDIQELRELAPPVIDVIEAVAVLLPGQVLRIGDLRDESTMADDVVEADDTLDVAGAWDLSPMGVESRARKTMLKRSGVKVLNVGRVARLRTPPKGVKMNRQPGSLKAAAAVPAGTMAAATMAAVASCGKATAAAGVGAPASGGKAARAGKRGKARGVRDDASLGDNSLGSLATTDSITFLEPSKADKAGFKGVVSVPKPTKGGTAQAAAARAQSPAGGARGGGGGGGGTHGGGGKGTDAEGGGPLPGASEDVNGFGSGEFDEKHVESVRRRLLLYWENWTIDDDYNHGLTFLLQAHAASTRADLETRSKQRRDARAASALARRRMGSSAGSGSSSDRDSDFDDELSVTSSLIEAAEKAARPGSGVEPSIALTEFLAGRRALSDAAEKALEATALAVRSKRPQNRGGDSELFEDAGTGAPQRRGSIEGAFVPVEAGIFDASSDDVPQSSSSSSLSSSSSSSSSFSSSSAAAAAAVSASGPSPAPFLPRLACARLDSWGRSEHDKGTHERWATPQKRVRSAGFLSMNAMSAKVLTAEQEEAQARREARRARDFDEFRQEQLEADVGKWDGVMCLSGRVHKLNLARCRPPLHGPLGGLLGSLNLLTDLQRLNLSSNKLTGPVPGLALARLANLKQINLSSNKLTVRRPRGRRERERKGTFGCCLPYASRHKPFRPPLPRASRAVYARVGCRRISRC